MAPGFSLRVGSQVLKNKISANNSQIWSIFERNSLLVKLIKELKIVKSWNTGWRQGGLFQSFSTVRWGVFSSFLQFRPLGCSDSVISKNHENEKHGQWGSFMESMRISDPRCGRSALSPSVRDSVWVTPSCFRTFQSVRKHGNQISINQYFIQISPRFAFFILHGFSKLAEMSTGTNKNCQKRLRTTQQTTNKALTAQQDLLPSFPIMCFPNNYFKIWSSKMWPKWWKFWELFESFLVFENLTTNPNRKTGCDVPVKSQGLATNHKPQFLYLANPVSVDLFLNMERWYKLQSCQNSIFELLVSFSNHISLPSRTQNKL